MGNSKENAVNELKEVKMHFLVLHYEFLKSVSKIKCIPSGSIDWNKKQLVFRRRHSSSTYCAAAAFCLSAIHQLLMSSQKIELSRACLLIGVAFDAKNEKVILVW